MIDWNAILLKMVEKGTVTKVVLILVLGILIGVGVVTVDQLTGIWK